MSTSFDYSWGSIGDGFSHLHETQRAQLERVANLRSFGVPEGEYNWRADAYSGLEVGAIDWGTRNVALHGFLPTPPIETRFDPSEPIEITPSSSPGDSLVDMAELDAAVGFSPTPAPNKALSPDRVALLPTPKTLGDSEVLIDIDLSPTEAVKKPDGMSGWSIPAQFS